MPEKKWVIEDLNDIEEDIHITGYEELRTWTKAMLRYYYELRSDYGEPIGYLLGYIPDEKLPEIIMDFNYCVKEEE